MLINLRFGLPISQPILGGGNGTPAALVQGHRRGVGQCLATNCSWAEQALQRSPRSHNGSFLRRYSRCPTTSDDG